MSTGIVSISGTDVVLRNVEENEGRPDDVHSLSRALFLVVPRKESEKHVSWLRQAFRDNAPAWALDRLHVSIRHSRITSTLVALVDCSHEWKIGSEIHSVDDNTCIAGFKGLWTHCLALTHHGAELYSAERFMASDPETFRSLVEDDLDLTLLANVIKNKKG